MTYWGFKTYLELLPAIAAVTIGAPFIVEWIGWKMPPPPLFGAIGAGLWFAAREIVELIEGEP